MSAIRIPDRVGALDDLTAHRECGWVARALRGSAAAVSDVASWTRGHAAPRDWAGRSADAADHGMTVFAGATDVVATALERATTACAVYADQVADLHREHDLLAGERVGLNRAIDDLAAEAGATGVLGGAGLAELAARADLLRARTDGLRVRVAHFWDRVAAAEDRLVASLRSVDSAAEGVRAATTTGRADTGALRRRIATLGGDAVAVNAWWRSLTRAEREALKISDPSLVGNTGGIPARDRDEANRAALERDLDRLAARDPDDLAGEERALLARGRAARDALAVPAGEVDRLTGEAVEVHLLVYRPAAFGGDGAVAVAYGDPDTADNTAVVVPGMTNDGTSIVGQGHDAYQLFLEAQLQDETTASIAWMGYDSPSWNPRDALDWPGDGFDLGSVVREDRAEAGGLLLADFVDGLRAADEGERSHLSVIGHSYGSTTSAHAAHDHGLAADSLTLLGSPGAGGDVSDVSDLGMPRGRVYVGAADHDFVTWLGRPGDLGMGEDPARAGFGATRFEVAHGEPFHVDTIGQGVANHTSYFDRETNPESLANLTAIVTGAEPTVVEGRQQGANAMAVEWAEGEILDGLRDFRDLWR